MAKGNSCPNCGETTFHQEGPTRTCSKCGAVGWFRSPNGFGGGKGRTCGACGAHTLHSLGRVGGLEIRHCSNTDCLATIMFQ